MEKDVLKRMGALARIDGARRRLLKWISVAGVLKGMWVGEGLAKSRKLNMGRYLTFKDAADTASVMTYKSEETFWQLESVAKNVTGTFTAKFIFDGKTVGLDNLKIPPIGLWPDVEYFGQDRYRPNGQWFEFFSVGLRMFVAPRLKDILDLHGVKAFYSDAYLEFNGERLIYHNFVPLLALDATDWKNSGVKMDEYDLKNEDVIQRRNKAWARKIYKLVLDKSKIPDGTPFFVLARNSRGIMLIRDDIAREIEAAGIRGVSIKDVEGQEWS